MRWQEKAVIDDEESQHALMLANSFMPKHLGFCNSCGTLRASRPQKTMV